MVSREMLMTLTHNMKMVDLQMKMMDLKVVDSSCEVSYQVKVVGPFGKGGVG